MRAILYQAFRSPLQLVDLPDPTPPADGVVVAVRACGLCLSDWHGWMGHDPDIRVPHVPGHELAGTVIATGKDVRKWRAGDRVTVPFCIGCGACERCRAGDQHICDHYYQPGFTGWGSFAEFVALPHADLNLVRLPESLDDVTAALLGCRFATAYRAIVAQGRAQPGEWVAVHGCGGVGLSAVMIAHAVGARVIAVDIAPDKLRFAQDLGAEVAIDANAGPDVPAAIRAATGGGAHLSLDALGGTTTCLNSITSLRKRGRHIQVGLMTGAHAQPPIPMGAVIANELEIRGSHGMAAQQYGGMLELITTGKLHPERLLQRTIPLREVVDALPRLGEFRGVGVTVAVLDR